jgi:hypothetical protein
LILKCIRQVRGCDIARRVDPLFCLNKDGGGGSVPGRKDCVLGGFRHGELHSFPSLDPNLLARCQVACPTSFPLASDNQSFPRHCEPASPRSPLSTLTSTARSGQSVLPGVSGAIGANSARLLDHKIHPHTPSCAATPTSCGPHGSPANVSCPPSTTLQQHKKGEAKRQVLTSANPGSHSAFTTRRKLLASEV